jgi:hypothetical protein
MGWLYVHGVTPLWTRTCHWAPLRLRHGAAEDTSALWVSAAIGHAWGRAVHTNGAFPGIPWGCWHPETSLPYGRSVSSGT